MGATEVTAEHAVNISAVPNLSPFRYPGGKTWLAPTVASWLRGHPRPEVFLEPFAGGAAVGLYIATHQLADIVELVELDLSVSTVWETILEDRGIGFNRLVGRIEAFTPTPESVRDLLEENPRSVADWAFRTIVRNRVNYGGILHSMARPVNRGERGRGVAQRWYPATIIARLHHIRSLRGTLRFRRGDGLEAIARTPGAAMFIDPPYLDAGRRMYTHCDINHEALFELAAAATGPVMMSYDDHPYARKLAHRHGFTVAPASMKTNGHQYKTELLLTRD